MLPIPHASQAVAKIVGIDPGTETLGISTLSFNVDTFEIVECTANTYVGSKLLGSDWSGAIHGHRHRRIEAHYHNLLSILTTEQPLIIASEAPFILMRRPQAYGALMEIVSALKAAVQCYDQWRPLYMLPPSTVKQAVKAKGNADKHQVKKSILEIKELVDTAITPIEEMDEHSIDSLAVAYCILQLFRESKIEPLHI